MPEAVDPEFALEVDKLVTALLGSDPAGCEDARDRLLALGGFSHPYIRAALDRGAREPVPMRRPPAFPLPRHGSLAGFPLGPTVGRGGFAFVFRTKLPKDDPTPVCIKIGYGPGGGSTRVTRLMGPCDSPTSQGISEDEACADGLREDTHAAWSSEITGDEVREVIVEEAQLLRVVEGDVFPRVHAMGEENGVAFYVMDHLEGPTLRELVRRRQTPALPLPKLVARLCRELADLHRLDSRFFHGDLKPENIIVQGDRLRVIDPALRRDQGRLRATITIAYNPMALRGERADTCALALTLLEALFGLAPFQKWRQPIAAGRDASPDLRRTLLRLEQHAPSDRLQAQLFQWVIDPPDYATMDRGLRALA